MLLLGISFLVLLCVDRFPLLFIISPRYLYASTSSSVCPFRVSLLLGPFPILTTLHFGCSEFYVVFLRYIVCDIEHLLEFFPVIMDEAHIVHPQ